MEVHLPTVYYDSVPSTYATYPQPIVDTCNGYADPSLQHLRVKPILNIAAGATPASNLYYPRCYTNACNNGDTSCMTCGNSSKSKPPATKVTIKKKIKYPKQKGRSSSANSTQCMHCSANRSCGWCGQGMNYQPMGEVSRVPVPPMIPTAFGAALMYNQCPPPIATRTQQMPQPASYVDTGYMLNPPIPANSGSSAPQAVNPVMHPNSYLSPHQQSIIHQGPPVFGNGAGLTLEPHPLTRSYSATTNSIQSQYERLPQGMQSSHPADNTYQDSRLFNNGSFETMGSHYMRPGHSPISNDRYPRHSSSFGSMPSMQGRYNHGESTMMHDSMMPSLSTAPVNGRPPLPPRRTPVFPQSADSSYLRRHGEQMTQRDSRADEEMRKLQTEFSVLSKGKHYIDKGTFMTLLDATLNGQGNGPKEDISVLEGIFGSMDYKGDGVIDFDEFVNAYRKLRTDTATKQVVENRPSRYSPAPSSWRPRDDRSSKYSPSNNPYMGSDSDYRNRFNTTHSTNQQFISDYPQYQNNGRTARSSGGNTSFGGDSYSITTSQRI